MAGKKGMKHLRGHNKEHRDAIALSRIEQIIDSIVEGSVLCPKCQIEHQPKQIDRGAATLLIARYSKLRPSLQSSELTVKSDSYADELQRIADLLMKQQHTQDRPDPAQYQHSPPVTH